MLRHPLIRKALRSLAVVIYIGGSVHLAIITIAAIVYRKPNLLNPADFLGVRTLFPETESSTIFYFLGWAVLIGFYLFVFRFEHIKNHKFISDTREFLTNISFSKNDKS